MQADATTRLTRDQADQQTWQNAQEMEIKGDNSAMAAARNSVQQLESDLSNINVYQGDNLAASIISQQVI
jgi:hypothetical protein